MASGSEGLLLHDYRPGLPHHQAFHGSAGDHSHIAAHSISNASAHTAPNSAARSSAAAAAAAAPSPDADASSSASPGASGTSRSLQLCGGHVDDVGSRQEGMVLHQSPHRRRQPHSAAGPS